MSIGRSQFASDVEFREALRDHFAGLAMQGIEAHEPMMPFDSVASMAYKIADAMIRARTNPRGETK